jgi:hypothetical protein
MGQPRQQSSREQMRLIACPGSCPGCERLAALEARQAALEAGLAAAWGATGMDMPRAPFLRLVSNGDSEAAGA